VPKNVFVKNHRKIKLGRFSMDWRIILKWILRKIARE
jgi:hypothetical protein